MKKSKKTSGYLCLIKYTDEEIYRIDVGKKIKLLDIDNSLPYPINPMIFYPINDIDNTKNTIYNHLKDFHLKGNWYKAPYESINSVINYIQRKGL